MIVEEKHKKLIKAVKRYNKCDLAMVLADSEKRKIIEEFTNSNKAWQTAQKKWIKARNKSVEVRAIIETLEK